MNPSQNLGGQSAVDKMVGQKCWPILGRVGQNPGLMKSNKHSSLCILANITCSYQNGDLIVFVIFSYVRVMSKYFRYLTVKCLRKRMLQLSKF